MTPAALARRNRTRIMLAFLAVYLVWGGTYLAIRFAVAVIPPFFMGATRMLTAGLLLYAAVRLRGAPAPSLTDMRTAALSGLLMLGIGNGSVMWAAQVVPSGILSLIIAGVPLWMVVAEWLRPGGTRPRAHALAGVGVGLVGITILIGPRILGGGNVDPVGALVLVLGSMSWAIGSVMSRHWPRPTSALISVSLQIIAAGVAFAIASVVSGELLRFGIDQLTTRAMLSWMYLVFGGSLIGYTAYVYLLSAVTPAKAATYAYVTPVIAVLVGWAFGGEALGPRTIAAASVILASVAITTGTQGS